MARRPVLSLVVAIAVQAVAGCNMPGKSGVTAYDDRSPERTHARRMRVEKLRAHVESAKLGAAQLFPGGAMADARQVPPLVRPTGVIPVAVLSVPARPKAEESVLEPSRPVSLVAAARSLESGCSYKPVMSDADLEACR
jgi:hypothetical protein